MKNILFAVLVLFSSAAIAQKFRCPDFYPEKNLQLAEMPSGYKGSGLLRGADLSSAFIYVGELHSDALASQTMLAVPTKVKDGWDMVENFDPEDAQRWLVCVYGGDRESVDRPRLRGRTEWWEKIDATYSSCVLKFREAKQRRDLPSRWSATVECKRASKP